MSVSTADTHFSCHYTLSARPFAKVKLRDLILTQFEPDIAVALLEFGKSLKHIDADAFIFLARKSLCLYDVLVKIGVPPIERAVMSDRVLDLDLTQLRGKRVALIDDTLIVGTTIAKAKERLMNEAGASISTHVFCLDQDWYNPQLAEPDTVSLRLPDTRVMSFCAAEVRALSLLPRPYLVDFPWSGSVRTLVTEMDATLSSTGWIGTRLSTRLQEKHGVDVLTFFPAENILMDLEKHFGAAVFSTIDLHKVRMFSRDYQEVSHLQIVPIITLKPLKANTLAALLDHLLSRIEKGANGSLSALRRQAVSPIAHQRLAQYILSISLGQMFFHWLGTFLKQGPAWVFDDSEAARHYGPWVERELSVINQHSYKSLQKIRSAVPITHFPVTHIPKAVHSWIQDILPSNIIKYKRSAIRRSVVTSNLLAAFTGVFLRMYDKRELPARQEAKRLGATWMDGSQHAPNRDRLESGITWEMLVAWLTRQLGIKTDGRVRNVLSLMLDYCNDLGISVPITCCRNGIVFRAYRHGEDVRFSDSELALTYHLVQGFLEGSHADSVPRLVLEKMLVLMFKIGVARGFLDPLYGNTGTDGIGKVCFDLMGARPLLQRGPKACRDRDIWLTDYLVQREVLSEGVRLKEGRVVRGKYLLKSLPAGNFMRPTAPDDAFELGSILGLLRSPNITSRSSVLDDQALILLATCSSSHSTANALQVELHIVQEWLERDGYRILSQLVTAEVGSAKLAFDGWVTGKGHYAIYSGKLKYCGFTSGRCEKIVAAGSECLKQTQGNGILARKWESYWRFATTSVAVSEKTTFDPLIQRAASFLWTLAALFSLVEIALCYMLTALDHPGSKKLLQTALGKLRSYREEMSATGISEPKLVTQICHRIETISSPRQPELSMSESNKDRSVTAEPPFEPEKALAFAQQEFASIMDSVAAFVDRIDPLLENFGKTPSKHEYKYMLFYDIVDSTATCAGRAGTDVAAYRNKVLQLKQRINAWFNQNILIAKKRGAELFVWNGDKDSYNDCKYVFFSGKLCLQFVASTMRMLIDGAYDYGHLNLRIEIIPCDFAGTSAFRLDRRSEVEGDRFWEHYSRVHKRVLELEKSLNPDKTTLFIATERLKDEIRIGDSLDWTSERHEMTSEIELLRKITIGYYGHISINR